MDQTKLYYPGNNNTPHHSNGVAILMSKPPKDCVIGLLPTLDRIMIILKKLRQSLIISKLIFPRLTKMMRCYEFSLLFYEMEAWIVKKDISG